MSTGAPERLTVAVTGPTGDIGRSLLRALEASDDVAAIRAMARSPFDPAAAGLRKTDYRRADVLDADVVGEVIARGRRGRPPRVRDHGKPRADDERQPRGLAQRVPGGDRRRRRTARVRLVGRRVRLPRRQPGAPHRGRAGARDQAPLLLGPEGRARAGPTRDARRLGDRRLRVPTMRRRRARRADDAQQHPLPAAVRADAGRRDASCSS